MKHPIPPTRWFGGKQRDAAALAALLPAHDAYVEPFGGTWAVGLAKPRAETEIASDINWLIVNLLTEVRNDPDAVLRHMPADIDRADYFESQAQCWAAHLCVGGRLSNRAQEEYAQSIVDGGAWLRCSPELAAHTIVACSVGYDSRLYGKRVGDTGFSYREPARLMKRLERLGETSARLRGVNIVQEDASEVMSRWDSPTTCYLVDPPYIPVSEGGGSRSDRATYGPGEAGGDDWHLALIEQLDGLRAAVLLTVGEDSLYTAAMEQRGWNRVWTKAAPQRKRGTTTGHVAWLKEAG